MTVRQLMEKLDKKNLLDHDIAVCADEYDTGSDFNIEYNDYCVFLTVAPWGSILTNEPIEIDEEGDKNENLL